MNFVKYSILNCLLVFTVSYQLGISQNTVGLIAHNKTKSYQGLNLFFPHNQSSVFLINNCGELVNEWTDDNDFRPGNMVYLTEEGNLLKCKRNSLSNQDPIWAGGGGQIVEMLDWDNNLLWSFELNDENQRLHHDVALLPNGNVLMIAWESKSMDDVISQGRDPMSLEQDKLYPDYIFEYDPAIDSIVWEWHVWDHIIQDFDESKENFGVVADNPQLVDINWNTNDGFPDWMHTNAIDYNEELDQILLCVPHFDEIWIIDHSTTTEEAAGHTGGDSGKGGDLLWRWGNPITYKVDGPQQVFFAHDAQWADNFRSPEQDYYSGISIFNNRVADDFSTANVITPIFSADGISYELNADNTFLPERPDLTLTHPDTTSLYSNSLSGAQVLPNGNFLICAGRYGRVFEIEPSSNKVVWEYLVPLKQGAPVDQGTVLEFNNNITFRFSRYPFEFKGFEGKDLTPRSYLELNPNIEFCDTVSTSIDITTSDRFIKVFPNPTDQNEITISKEGVEFEEVQIFDLQGKLISVHDVGKTSEVGIDISSLESGVYLITINNQIVEKLIVTK